MAKRRAIAKVLAVASLTAALLGTVARAQSDPAAATIAAAPERPNRLGLVLGLGSPWGAIGVAYQRRLGETLAIEGGAGLGPTGFQAAALPKLLFGRRTRFYVQGGPSLTASPSSTGLWADAELGFEVNPGNWTFGFGGGVGVLVAGSVQSPICFDACSTFGPGKLFPEIRFQLARNF
jgi:hypothetical protein